MHFGWKETDTTVTNAPKIYYSLLFWNKAISFVVQWKNRDKSMARDGFRDDNDVDDVKVVGILGVLVAVVVIWVRRARNDRINIESYE